MAGNLFSSLRQQQHKMVGRVTPRCFAVLVLFLTVPVRNHHPLSSCARFGGSLWTYLERAGVVHITVALSPRAVRVCRSSL